MARLNTHLSATPVAGRSSTVDSLYRDPTPASQQRAAAASTVRNSSYSVMSPALSQNSDKENELPESRENTPKLPSKSKRPMRAPAPRLPTPGSASSSSHEANKRRRTDDYNLDESSLVYEDDDAQAREEELEDGDREQQQLAHDDEDEATMYYNPNQDPNQRREVRASIRNNHREMEDKRDELVQPGNNLLLDYIKRQDHIMSKVRQTSDATLDARVIGLAADLAGKKLNNSLHGNNGVGLDVDQFVSKCISFMRSDGGTARDRGRAPTQAHQRRTALAEDDEEEDTGDGLDWAALGRYACFPHNKRPPTSSFLLGPLSVQKRARATQTRRARSQRQPVGPATRPQELKQSDIRQSENSNLTHVVKGIHTLLKDHINTGEGRVETELEEIDGEPDEEDISAACRRQRVHLNTRGEGAVSLFDFAINPHPSKGFGQTVENLFYISFLIREGTVLVDEDSNGLPLLVPAEPHSLQEQREKRVEKHQAVFSIDWPTWKLLIEAFDIKRPLIPHRDPEEADIPAGGWFG